MDVVWCFLYYEGEILLLKRQDHKPQPNTWGIPGWKVELWESFFQAIKRELYEETWLDISEEILLYKNTFSVIHELGISYHVFFTKLTELPKVTIDKNSHKDFCWISPSEALKRDDLIQDLDICIQDIFTKELWNIG
jgi:8-oxo-dGTP pyrophosphatase MutT (NUDIX family)